MLKRKILFIAFIVSSFITLAQETVDYKKLPDWIWGEYITSSGKWPMDLHKDFIIYSGKLSGYVSNTTVEDDVYCLTVTDYNPKKPTKKAWLKLGGKDTISVSFDNKRFVRLTKPNRSRFTRVDLKEYLQPIKGKWYAVDNSLIYAEFGNDSLILNGEKFAYNYVVKDGRTIQLNVSGSPYGRFIQLEKYTDLYMKIRASGMSSRVCKRKPEMPMEVSNEFEEISKELTGTFYTTDGKNTKITLKPYEVTLNNDTLPLKKLRLNEKGVLLKLMLNKRTTDVLLNTYNEQYIQYKIGDDSPVFLKRTADLPNGIEMQNPFMGEWYSTVDASTLNMSEVSFSGKGIGKGKFDQVLFTGQQYAFKKDGKVLTTATKYSEDYVELSTKKGVVLYKKNKNAPNSVLLTELPKSLLNAWYSNEGEWVYGIGETYVAFNKRFYTLDEISYQNQQYHLHTSYNDTVCYYNKNGDYVCEIVTDKKELALHQVDAESLSIKDVDDPNNVQQLSNRKGGAKATELEMKHNGTAVLLGHVENSEQLRSKVLTIYHMDVLYGDQTKHTATIDSGGFFKFEIPLLQTKSVWARFNGSVEIILTPNDTVLFTTTAQNLGATARWNMMGPNVELTQESAPFYSYYTKKINAKRYNELKAHYGLEPEEYALFMDSIYQSEQDVLHKYVDEKHSSTEFYAYWKNKIKLKDWDNRMRYRWMRSHSGGFARFEEHATYFDFIDSIPFDDENLWLQYDFRNVVHEVQMRDNRITSPKLNGLEVFKEIVAKDTTLSEENKELLQNISSLTKPTKAEKDTVNAIIGRNKKLLERLKREKVEEAGNSIVNTDYGLILADVFACGNYYRQLEASQNIDEGWEQLTMKVMDERFLKHMKIPYEKELAILNKAMPEYCLMNYPVKTSGDQFLKTLAEKHAGYVVYIDVWAPWCGPCRSEMEYAPSLKKALKDQPVHFVYLCGSGTKEAQEGCIKKYNLAGDHYYLERDTYEEITGKFNITGIPTFMIMDKNGIIINKKAPRPSSKTTIINTLKKYAELEKDNVVTVNE